MEKKIQIEMVNGSKKFLADLTSVDLEKVKLETKGDKSWLTMKSELIQENETHFVERRLYKWNVMPSLVMYDVCYGKTLDILKKELGEKVTYAHAMRDFIIAQDKLHNGIVAEGSGKRDEKYSHKFIAELEAKGAKKEEIEAVRKALLKAGFLK